MIAKLDVLKDKFRGDMYTNGDGEEGRRLTAEQWAACEYAPY